MATEMTPLKAAMEPMLTRARRQATMLVKATAYTGIDVLSLTYSDVRISWKLTVVHTYLAKRAPSRKTSVTRESPADTGRRSWEPDVGTDGKDHHNRGHDRSAGSRLDRSVEDGHERECGVFLEDCVQIAHAEQHSEYHAKAERAVDRDAGHDRSRDDYLRVVDFFGQLEHIRHATVMGT